MLTYGKAYTLNESDSRRISVLKFISIVFVVIVHAYDSVYVGRPRLAGVMSIEYLVAQILGRSTVPLFFLLSGVLLFKKVRSYTQVLKQKARSVVVPYLLWNTFWILFFILMQSLSFTRSLFSADSVPILKRSFFQWLQLYGIGSMEPQDYPLWFLRDLIVIIAISPLIWKLADRFPRVTLLLSLAGAVFLPAGIFLRHALCYTLLAAWIVKADVHFSDLDRVPLALTTGIYLVLVCILWATRLDFLLGPVQLVGVIAWLRLSEKIRCPLLIKAADSIFFVFAAHELTLTSVKKLLYHVIPASPVPVLLAYFLVPISVILLCIAADRIVRKLTPGFHRLITGGR